MRGPLLLVVVAGALCAGTTYIGDAREYHIAQTVTDAAGNSYVTGSRPLPGPYGGPAVSDVFVMKVDPSGRQVWLATFGGKGRDAGRALALDGSGNVFVAGSTDSSNWPLRNPLQANSSERGFTGFLMKLSPDGSQVLFSTYLGGSSTTEIDALATDAEGNCYAAGSTTSSDYPVTPGLPAGSVSYSVPIVSGAFLTKISAAGDRIVYSTVIAGSALACTGGSSCFLATRYTSAEAVGVDAAGNAYVAANTNTTDISGTPSALLSRGSGAFVFAVNAAGTAMQFLTFFTSRTYYPIGMTASGVRAMVVDPSGNSYLAGSTTDTLFPVTPGALQGTLWGNPPETPYQAPPSDGFLAKLRPDGRTLEWSTYLGRGGDDYVTALALAPGGFVWFSGTTNSTDFPNAEGWTTGPEFVSALDPAAMMLTHSARFPTGSAAQAITADSGGTVRYAGFDGFLTSFVSGEALTPGVFGIGNGAGGLLTGRLSPGEVISLYGPGIGPSTAAVAAPVDGVFPTTLGGIRVLIDGIAAPLLYVSTNQINCVAPSALTPRDVVKVSVSGGAETLPDYRVGVVDTTPEVFFNSAGATAVLNEDGTWNGTGNAAKPGSVVSVWLTGAGAGPGPDGHIVNGADTSYACCTVNGGSIEVLYVGPAPGLISGVWQLNFRVPPLGEGYTEPVFYNITISAHGADTAPFGLWVAR